MAKYDEAKPGTLRLVPPVEIIGQLRSDFKAMEALFYDDPPPFDDIISVIAEVEDQINN